MFSRTKIFCFENSVFLTFVLSMHERESVRAREVGKGESHPHPYHVDIQVGSCIFLSMFGCHYMCT